MKKTTLLSIFVFCIFILNAQIDKKMTIVEIGTGVDCSYCPAAANGAEELLTNFGETVAIIEYHQSFPFYISASGDRYDYYEMPGTPTALFNGGTKTPGGGDASTSNYSYWTSQYNFYNIGTTSFDLDININFLNASTYKVTLTIDKVASYSDVDVVTHLILTESGIEYEWEGMSELNHVARGMYPDANGTTLNLTNDQQVIEFTITIEDDWDISQCEFVAFIQDNSTQEVLQGVKQNMDNVGIETQQIEYINIYPNPSSGTFTVTNPQGFKNLVGLEITDITGKIIYMTRGHAPMQIDISNQPAGIYFINIKTENKIYTEKIIIQ